MSSTKKKQGMRVDVIGTSIELARMYKEDPSAIDRDDNQKGHDLVGIFDDTNYGAKFKDFNKMKLEAIKLAIDDLSRGGMTLKSSTIGLTYTNNKIQIYIMPLGANPKGSVIFNINLKNAKAFLKWRKGESPEIEQDDLNAAIYRLTVAMSEYI